MAGVWVFPKRHDFIKVLVQFACIRKTLAVLWLGGNEYPYRYVLAGGVRSSVRMRRDRLVLFRRNSIMHACCFEIQ